MRLEPGDRLATIRHRKIEGYMDAMTMTFPVKDPKEFAALQIGNCIDGALYVQGDNLWVGDITHVSAAADSCVTPPAEPQKAP
jgi:Cu/Ag efflux protein CusF